MELPVRPPVAPMLARLARELPTAEGYRYEPKWDGFRCLAFRDRDHAFDLLCVGDRDLRDAPFATRRSLLEEVLDDPEAPVLLTPSTGERAVAAEWLERFAGGGVDGVMAKHEDLRYQPGKRARDMVKVKRERTADCVVAGFRWLADRPVLGSLLLGLHDDTSGELRHVGVCSSFTEGQRASLLADLRPVVVPLEGHVWEQGFNIGPSPTGRLKGAAGRWVPGSMVPDWVPLAPVRVAEVAYDQLDGERFRHPARFLRWRPDRDARSCTFEQLAAESLVLPELGCGKAPAR